jgi:hypothetical protein
LTLGHVDLAVGDVFWNVEVHGPRSAIGCDDERPTDEFWDTFDSVNAKAQLGCRLQHAKLVSLLCSSSTGDTRVHLPGEDYHRDRGGVRLRDSGQKIGGAWAQRRIDYCWSSSDAGEGVSRKGTISLIADQYVPDRILSGECVIVREKLKSSHTECVPHPVKSKHTNKNVTASESGHHSAPRKTFCVLVNWSRPTLVAPCRIGGRVRLPHLL